VPKTTSLFWRTSSAPRLRDHATDIPMVIGT